MKNVWVFGRALLTGMKFFGSAFLIFIAVIRLYFYGLYHGEITRVSDHVLLANEWRQAPIAVEEPMYRVTDTLHRQGVMSFGQQPPLRPGIVLDADITLGQRTLMHGCSNPCTA